MKREYVDKIEAIARRVETEEIGSPEGLPLLVFAYIETSEPDLLAYLRRYHADREYQVVASCIPPEITDPDWEANK